MRVRTLLPPGPSYPSLLQGLGFWTRPLAFLERTRARYGRRFTIRRPFSPPFVFITDPDEIKQVYTAPADVLRPGEGARVLEPVVGGNSVILLDGASHMEQRKLMPAFHGAVEARGANRAPGPPRRAPSWRLALCPRIRRQKRGQRISIRSCARPPARVT